jgi:hypothetical protein
VGGKKTEVHALTGDRAEHSARGSTSLSRWSEGRKERKAWENVVAKGVLACMLPPFSQGKTSYLILLPMVSHLCGGPSRVLCPFLGNYALAKMLYSQTSAAFLAIAAVRLRTRPALSCATFLAPRALAHAYTRTPLKDTACLDETGARSYECRPSGHGSRP